MLRQLTAVGLGWLMLTSAAGLLGAEQAAVGAPWSGADVGRVGLAGNHSETEGVCTLHGAGGGVFVAGDGFYFVWTPRQGDFEITARAVGLKNGVANSILGLMARESLEYDAKDVYLFLRPNRDYIAACQARTSDDVESVQTAGKQTGVKFPCWLRMTRRGQTFEVLLSPDGKQWRSLGSVSTTLADHLYVGLMLCSYRTSLLSEAVFDNVTVSGTIPPSDRFRQAVAQTLQRAAGEAPRDPRLDAFDALAQARREHRGELVFPARKKLISANVHAMPPPARFVAQLPEYEQQRPFAGVVLTLQGGQRPFGRRKWDEARFLEDYQALAALESKVFTDNFVLVHTNAAIDWFDDRQWESVLHNTRIMAKAAAIGRCAGLFIDPEGYGANAWSYYDAIGNDEKTFEQFSAQVERRGAEWVQAVEAELPSPRLLFAFLLPTTRLMYDLQWPIEKITADVPRMRYGLLPSFVNGVLRGAGPATKLIEGNEHAYYYRRPEDYQTYARYVHDVLPKAFLREDLWPKCARQVQVGLSLYPNFYFGLSYKSIAQHMTADERARWYEHNIYHALQTADEYVWDWLEGPPTLWATGPDWAAGDKLPPRYVDAIRSARQKAAAGVPLGFDSASLFAAVKSRAAQQRPAAQVSKLTARPPAIDGQLEDDAWKQAGFGFTFRPMLAWRQQGHQPTLAGATYDGEALYLAFRCLEDRPQTMRARTTAPDDYFLVQDDHVQVLIASSRQPQKLVYRFVLSSHGLTNDAFIRENPDPEGREREPLVVDVRGFNPDWQHAVQVLQDSWTAEIRIPWSSVEIQPQPDAALLMNLGRFRSQGLNWERTYWAPVLEMQGDTFERLDTDLFGTVQLRP